MDFDDVPAEGFERPELFAALGASGVGVVSVVDVDGESFLVTKRFVADRTLEIRIVVDAVDEADVVAPVEVLSHRFRRGVGLAANGAAEDFVVGVRSRRVDVQKGPIFKLRFADGASEREVKLLQVLHPVPKRQRLLADAAVELRVSLPDVQLVAPETSESLVAKRTWVAAFDFDFDPLTYECCTDRTSRIS